MPSLPGQKLFNKQGKLSIVHMRSLPVWLACLLLPKAWRTTLYFQV